MRNLAPARQIQLREQLDGSGDENVPCLVPARPPVWTDFDVVEGKMPLLKWFSQMRALQFKLATKASADVASPLFAGRAIRFV